MHGTAGSTVPTVPFSSAANVDCPKYAAIAQRIALAQAKIYTPGAAGDSALRSLQTDLGALKAKAPSAVDTAVDDLIAGFASVSKIVTASPPPADAGKQLSKLSPRLTADTQVIAAYVTTACK